MDIVQQQMESRKRPRKNGTIQIFAGLLKCADCGKTMRFCRHTQHGKYPYDYYCCRYYANYGTEICTQHYLRYDKLYPYILSRIQHWAEQDEINETKKRKADIDRLFAKMYED